MCFKSNGVANNRIKDLSELGVNLIPFQIGDDERTYKFNEVHFPIVSEVVKAKKVVRLNLSDEERLLKKERLANSRRKWYCTEFKQFLKITLKIYPWRW